MIIYVVYDGKVAVGYSRNLRKAKDMAHEKHADEIQELRICDVKNELHMDLVRKWKRAQWSQHFYEWPIK